MPEPLGTNSLGGTIVHAHGISSSRLEQAILRQVLRVPKCPIAKNSASLSIVQDPYFLEVTHPSGVATPSNTIEKQATSTLRYIIASLNEVQQEIMCRRRIQQDQAERAVSGPRESPSSLSNKEESPSRAGSKPSGFNGDIILQVTTKLLQFGSSPALRLLSLNSTRVEQMRDISLGMENQSQEYDFSEYERAIVFLTTGSLGTVTGGASLSEQEAQGLTILNETYCLIKLHSFLAVNDSGGSPN